MDDLISRQAAIDAFMKATSDGDKFDWCKWVLKQVPSEQPEPKWIPCSERLPEEKREVLVSTKDGYLNIAFLETLSTGDLEWTDVIEYFQIPNVTAWMPLPEPYAERRTDDSISD